MGKSLPVRTWTTYLPFMDSFRFPSLFRLFALFFFLFSAGFSLHYLSQSVQVRKVFNRLLIVAMICFGIYNIFLFSGVEQYKFMQIITIGWLHFLNVSQINELIFLQSGVLILLMGLFLLMCKFKLFGDPALGWKKAFLLVFVIEIVSFTWMNRYVTVLDNRSLNDASVGMDTLPEGFPTPSSTLPLNTFNDVNQSHHFDRLWKNLSIYFKRPTYDGISPYTYTNMVRAMETGEFDKLIKYPIYFFAERLDKNNHIDTTTIDTLSSQKFWVETFSPNELTLHVELPDAFLKRWIQATNDKPLTVEQLDYEYPQYANQLRWTLIENHLIQSNDIKVTHEEVKNKVKESIAANFAQYGIPVQEENLEEYAKNSMSNQEEIRKVYEQLFEERLMQLIREKCIVESKKISFEEFVHAAQH
jgi:hypothetical protein